MYLRHLPFFLKLTALILLIVAISGPRLGKKNNIIQAKGIDIMLCLDISESMIGEDIQPGNRLTAAKDVISEFILKRKNDRIGLVVFGAQSFLQCPLTLDHSVLNNFVKKVDFIQEIKGKTAIGMALANAVNSIKNSESKSKIIILLTDGANNAGEIDPVTAAEIASSLDIKIYTIGLGKPGISDVPYTQNHPFYGKQTLTFRNNMNDKLLKEISQNTEGIYFNAQNKESLKKVYQEINQYEKTEIETNQYSEYQELFQYFISIALLLLSTGIFLSSTWLLTIP